MKKFPESSTQATHRNSKPQSDNLPSSVEKTSPAIFSKCLSTTSVSPKIPKNPKSYRNHGLKTDLSKVLFHLKPEVTDTQISEWSAMAKSQLGQVPGLLSIEANKPLPVSVSRTKGYDMALVAVLEGPEFVEGYAKFAAQSQYVSFPLRCMDGGLMIYRAQTFREQLFDDTIAFDLQF